MKIIEALLIESLNALFSVFQTDKWSLCMTIVDLARATDVFVLFAHFFPLRNPTGQPAKCKQHREHWRWKAQCFVNNS